ncbi:adenylyl-sulfate kinase [Leptospira ilyithenensis]|uniref:Adenylyl-sulfate kinase n=1 Tax=Leptospira ilyithenensis TaxID=2484901 RepID=A0A4R9LKA6_9LEPT|nr:adenylyl-sulfate kinase [Leptospira ilyithenensis]TGN08005.1 adenylyl-sulfate kinase [Leptospira ilyithenensis]
MVIWLIGLSGAGKTAIGQSLFNELKNEYSNLVYLDGDIIREVFGDNLGYTIEDRKKNADRICRLCKMLDSQKIHVVCSILSIFEESREWNRTNLSQYFEIFIDVSRDVLSKRNQKGLYEKAERGEIKNVVGFDIPFEIPEKPNLIIKNDDDVKEFTSFVKLIRSSLPDFK